MDDGKHKQKEREMEGGGREITCVSSSEPERNDLLWFGPQWTFCSRSCFRKKQFSEASAISKHIFVRINPTSLNR